MLQMKKFLCALVMLLVFVPSAFSAETHRVGMVERLNVTHEDFNNMIANADHVIMLAKNTLRPKFVF